MLCSVIVSVPGLASVLLQCDEEFRKRLVLYLSALLQSAALSARGTCAANQKCIKDPLGAPVWHLVVQACSLRCRSQSIPGN